jgi:hypothetical protein
LRENATEGNTAALTSILNCCFFTVKHFSWAVDDFLQSVLSSMVSFIGLLCLLLMPKQIRSGKRNRMLLREYLSEPVGVTESRVNHPRFLNYAVWDPNAITFVDSSAVNGIMGSIFVDKNDSVYLTVRNLNQVIVWDAQSPLPVVNIAYNLGEPCGVVATFDGTIFIANGFNNSHVERWNRSSTQGTFLMNVSHACNSLFIDQNNFLYCSMMHMHQVVKFLLDSSNSTLPKAIAGDGNAGSNSYQLHQPHGIFVDEYFSLYIADHDNNRIQQFVHGVQNGTTIVGGSPSVGCTIMGPTSVMFDEDGYLFISESGNRRIIMETPFGFVCIAGCLGMNEMTPYSFSNPMSMSFDHDGNIFVSDLGNNRIQILVYQSADICESN